MYISAVIPAYNEAESLPVLRDELLAVLEPLDRPFELVFVNDGSTDHTGKVMNEMAAADERIVALHLARNMGKSAAYMAGFDAVQGDVVLTLDADLQDDPNEITKVLAELEGGFDLVVGWKVHRMGNEPHKTVPSRVFNRINNLLFGLSLTDTNSGFRAMKHAVAKALVLYGDNYRFIPQLSHVRGFRVGQVGVIHRKRQFGYSKYGPVRFWTGLLDLLSVRFLSRYKSRPLHFFGTIGLGPFVVGGGLEVYAGIMKLLGDSFQTHIAAIIIGVLLILAGLQCVLTGLIGEMIRASLSGPAYELRKPSSR